MTHTAKNRFSAALVLGLGLIVWGSVLLLERFGLIWDVSLGNFWPIILIVAGIFKIASPEASGRFWGFVLLTFGVLLQLSKLGMGIRFYLWDFWPLLIVAVGIKLVFDSVTRPKVPATQNTSSASLVNAWAMFGGVEKQINAQDFRGGELTAVFGGIDLDLRNANLAGTDAVLQANAIFGGVGIKVPPDWSVVADGVGFMGGYGDSTQQPKIDNPGAVKRLFVKGVAVFGGVEIKN